MDGVLAPDEDGDFLESLEAARLEAMRNYVPRVYGAGELVAAAALYALRPDWAALFPIRDGGGGGEGDDGSSDDYGDDDAWLTPRNARALFNLLRMLGDVIGHDPDLAGQLVPPVAEPFAKRKAFRAQLAQACWRGAARLAKVGGWGVRWQRII